MPIGPYELPSAVVLAPMAGVTDRPFRIFLPVEFQAWQALNTAIYSALRSGAAEIDIPL